MNGIVRRGVTHLRRNTVAYLALVMAMGGTSYAAAQLPHDSVGAAQIRSGAVRSPDVKDGALKARDAEDEPAVRVDDDTQVEVHSASFALLSLDDEVFDTGEMHPGNGRDDRVWVPKTGTYVVHGEVEWEADDSGYRRVDLVQLNHGAAVLGSTMVEPRHSPIQATIQQTTAIVHLTEGTTIGMMAGQGSGDTLEVVRASLSAAFVGA